MPEPVIALGLRELLLLGLLVAGVLGLSLFLRLSLEREVALATLRSVVQLGAIALVIGWVFERRQWWWVLALLAVMTAIAGWTGARRSVIAVRRLSFTFSLVLGAVTAIALFHVSVLVLRLESWDPRYLVPLGGMLLGNAMTAGTLAMERTAADLRQTGSDVEVLLSLGASPGQAARTLRRAAVHAAMLPTLNTMMIVGVVQLPGMMTGQILGGTAPHQAAAYQLLILFGIAFTTCATAVIIVELLHRRAFTDAWQLDRSALAPRARSG